MALTQVSTNGIKNQTVQTADIADDAITPQQLANDAVQTQHYTDGSIASAHIGNYQITSTHIAANNIVGGHIVDTSITLDKLPNGTSSNNGKFLRANNGAAPSFETVSAATGATGAIQISDGSGNFNAVNTHSITGDSLFTHDLYLQRDGSNVDPIVQPGSGASVTYRTTTTQAGAFGSILDGSGLQLGRNTEYVKIVAPADVSGQTSYTLTLPHIAGSNGQVLTTNGSGTTSWSTITGTTVNNQGLNRIVTATSTTDTLDARSDLIWDGDKLAIAGSTSGNGVSLEIDSAASNSDSRHIDLVRSGNHGYIGMAGSQPNDPMFFSRSGDRDVLLSSAGMIGMGGSPATSSRLRVFQPTATDYNASTAANNPAIIISAASGGGADNKCVGFSINGPNANAEFNAAMVGNGSSEADFFVSMRSGGSRSDRFRMTHDKEIYLYATSNRYAKLLNNGDVFELRTSANSGNSGMLIFRDGNNDFCGQITSNGANNTTSYNSSSDYRLKTNESLITNGIARIKNLKPYQFEWKSDLGRRVDGFFAHEAQTVVPEAVTGVKDEMLSIVYTEADEIPEGKELGDVKEVSTTEIKPQTIDLAKFVPVLTAALQEVVAKIETLETKVAALEAA